MQRKLPWLKRLRKKNAGLCGQRSMDDALHYFPNRQRLSSQLRLMRGWSSMDTVLPRRRTFCAALGP
eukprot:2449152-Pyramimonas_sp.AAC.1